MKIYKLITTAALVLVAAQVPAQQTASNLNELLDRVRAGSAADNREHQDRLNQFRQQAAEQDRLLAEARTRQANEEARSEQLETTFEENELLIQDVQGQLDERLGSLRELFGVLQQVSGDARSTFENSLTNVEFPDRSDFPASQAGCSPN